MTRRRITGFAFPVAWFVLLTASPAFSVAGEPVCEHVMELAQAHGTQPGELEPRYQPVPPQEESWYETGYLFAMTRGVANSTIVPAAKAPLYILTVPLDLVTLPFAAIGGLFG